MNLSLSKHAEKRVQQRAFSHNQLDIIQEYGTPSTSNNNTISIDFKIKEYKALVLQCDYLIEKIKKIKNCAEKAKNKRLIIDSYRNNVITMYRI